MFGFITACLALCSGCISGRSAGVIVAEAIETAFGPPLILARGADEFRSARGHWPKDYPELCRFLQESHSQTYKQLQAVRFNHIDFSETPDHNLKVNADYAIASTNTASGITVTFSVGTIRIENMIISPGDPHETRIGSTPEQKTN